MGTARTRRHRSALSRGLRSVVAGVAYLASLVLMAVTVALRAFLFALLAAVVVEVAFGVGGTEPPALVRSGYWLVGGAIAVWSLYRVVQLARSGARVEAAALVAETRSPAEDERDVRAALERLCQSVDRPVPALRIREDDRPLCYTVSYPDSDPPLEVLESDVGAYRSVPSSRRTDGADDPIPEPFVVVVSTGLLDRLTADQVTAVLAHEVAHLRNGDPKLTTALVVPLGWAQSALPGGGGILGMLVLGVPALLMVLAAAVALAVFKRGREFDADAGAVAMTGDPSALAAALELLAADAPDRPSDDLRSVSVLNVVSTGDSLVDRLVYPPVEKRVQRLRSSTART